MLGEEQFQNAGPRDRSQICFMRGPYIEEPFGFNRYIIHLRPTLLPRHLTTELRGVIAGSR